MTGKLPTFSRKRTLEVQSKHFRDAFDNAITNQRPEAVGYAGDLLKLYGTQLSYMVGIDVMTDYPARRPIVDSLDSFLLKFYIGKGTMTELVELAGAGELTRINPLPDGDTRGIFGDVGDTHIRYDEMELLARGLAKRHEYGRISQLLFYIDRGGHLAD